MARLSMRRILSLAVIIAAGVGLAVLPSDEPAHAAPGDYLLTFTSNQDGDWE
ncbi:MAG: hypothetical protein GF320_22320, partial [Armatimonadia bacterium]|nr:hypothetical protein [Armatimonadia bacterium]